MTETNRNGIGNEKVDSLGADDVWIGFQAVSASEFPEIASVSPMTLLSDETTAVFYAENVTSSTTMSSVWATVLRPDFDPGSVDNPVTEMPVFDLTHVGNDRYEGTYSEFNVNGEYAISIHAKDSQDFLAITKQIRVLKNVVLGDIDGDMDVDLADSILALKISCGVLNGTENINISLNVSGDRDIGIEEVVYILQSISKLR